MRRAMQLLLLSLIFGTAVVIAPDVTVAESAIISSVDVSALPDKKRTSLGLYVTAKEAASLLQNRTDVALLDVRTPEETMFVGYPEAAAANIPFKLIDPEYSFDANKGSYKLILNPDFVASVRVVLNTPAGKRATAILLMCRSGNRSAQAANLLTEEIGFSNIYSVVDGFEGDKDDNGKRTINGWKNSGAPWTTKVHSDYWFRAQ